MGGEAVYSSQARKSSTRARATVISNGGSGSALMRSLPPNWRVMLRMALSATMHPREMRKNLAGSSSSEMVSSDESMM